MKIIFCKTFFKKSISTEHFQLKARELIENSTCKNSELVETTTSNNSANIRTIGTTMVVGISIVFKYFARKF
jgi:hypothetical protein